MLYISRFRLLSQEELILMVDTYPRSSSFFSIFISFAHARLDNLRDQSLFSIGLLFLESGEEVRYYKIIPMSDIVIRAIRLRSAFEWDYILCINCNDLLADRRYGLRREPCRNTERQRRNGSASRTH